MKNVDSSRLVRKVKNETIMYYEKNVNRPEVLRTHMRVMKQVNN